MEPKTILTIDDIRIGTEVQGEGFTRARLSFCVDATDGLTGEYIHTFGQNTIIEITRNAFYILDDDLFNELCRTAAERRRLVLQLIKRVADELHREIKKTYNIYTGKMDLYSPARLFDSDYFYTETRDL